MSEAIDHAQRAHSIVGPSSANRVVGCRGSVQMIRAHGVESPASRAALEGTRAHEIMEAALSRGAPIENVESDEMAAAAALFVQEVQTEIARDPDNAILLIEARVNLQRMHPDLFGSVDACVLLPRLRHATILDLKTGVKPVEADAPQVKLYGAMALEFLGKRADRVTTVDTVIVQPRAQHRDGPVRRVRHSAASIIDYASEYIEIVHEVTTANEPLPLQVGEWCWFCPARGACPAYRAHRLSLSGFIVEGNVPRPPTSAEGVPIADLARVLNGLDLAEEWIAAVRERAEALLTQDPDAIPGWGMVPKRPTKKWSDPQAALIALRRKGFPDEQITTTTIITPPQALKLVGKDAARDLNPLIVSESSGLKLARAD
jgi:Protein of unknown function (DUF2800)